MATSAGELIYTVGMDTKGLLSGAKQTQAEVSKTGAAMEQAGNQAAKLSTKMTGTAQAVNQATSSMGRARGVAQQFGYQIQDMAVQLQGGTNALTVIGQQGSQLAAVFGPTGALIGAIIAVAAAIGTSLVGATEKASDSFDDLITKIDQLSTAQKEFISIQLGERVRDDSKSIAELNQRIATLNNYQRTYGSLTEGQARDLAELKSAHDTLTQSIDDANKQLSTINDSHTKNIKKTKEAEEAYRDLAEQLGVEVEALKSGDKAAAIMAANIRLGSAATQEQKDKIATLISSVFDLKAAKEAQDKAQKSSASSAKSEQRSLESNEQKIESAKLKTQQLTIELENLKSGTEEITGATSRYSIESATLAAQQQLNKDATKQQVAALAEQILAQQRVNEAIAQGKKEHENKKKVTTEFETVEKTTLTAGESVDAKYQADLKALKDYHKLAGAENSRYEKAKARLERQYEKDKRQAMDDDYKAQSEGHAFVMDSLDALGNASTNAISGLLSGTMSVTEAMQSFANIILNQAVGALVEMGVEQVKNQMLSTALAQTQQANIATTTTASIAAGQANAAAQSAAAGSVAAASAPAAAATATWSFGQAALVGGAALAGTFALAKMLGGRQFGGPTDAGMYRVGENNQPEIYQSGGASYLISGDRGRVTPMSEIGSGGGFQQTVNVHNNSGASVSTRTSPDGKQMDVIINEIANQVENRRGRFARAMTSGTNTKFKAR